MCCALPKFPAHRISEQHTLLSYATKLWGNCVHRLNSWNMSIFISFSFNFEKNTTVEVGKPNLVGRLLFRGSKTSLNQRVPQGLFQD